MSLSGHAAHPFCVRVGGLPERSNDMGTTIFTPISNRDRAVLRAIAAGRGVVSGASGNPLTIDGFCCADQFAKARLTAAGLITMVGPVPAPARLTSTGQAVLKAAWSVPIPARTDLGVDMSVPTISPATVHTLTAFDRCDRCGARAKLQAVLPGGGELLFCTHHGRQHWAALAQQGADLHPTRTAWKHA